MNRKSKGWLAEGAVTKWWEARGETVWQLSPNEPCADLLIRDHTVCEVKFKGLPPKIVDGLLTEPRFPPRYKEAIDGRLAWCRGRGYAFELWIVVGPPSATMEAHRLTVGPLAPSRTRKGALSLRVLKEEKTVVDGAGAPHIAISRCLAPLPTPDGEAR